MDRPIETHAATHRINRRPCMLLCRACLQVVAKVWGYRKVWLQSHRVFETGLFSLPPMEYHTRGLFVHLPLGLQQEASLDGRAGCVCLCTCACVYVEEVGTLINTRIRPPPHPNSGGGGRPRVPGGNPRGEPRAAGGDAALPALRPGRHRDGAHLPRAGTVATEGRACYWAGEKGRPRSIRWTQQQMTKRRRDIKQGC